MPITKDYSLEFNIEHLKKFIDDNFENPDLNVNLVSLQFGISLSYMSRFFKKNAGLGMADYIMGCRIDKSKDYLKNTDINITDIVNLVGLGSPNVFVRAFKKREGLTPRDYRSKFRQI